jgi:hypothetical protein
MNAQDLINEIEREEAEIRNHKQDKPRCLNIEVIKQMTPNQVKQAQEFFQIQEEHELAEYNLSLCLKNQKEVKTNGNTNTKHRLVG